MSDTCSLSGNDWQVRGYLGLVWQMGSDDLWADRPGQEAEWIPATVPGMVQTDLVRAGIIPDPYYELNSFQCEWVPNRDWVYRKAFKVPAHFKGKRIRLRFHGVDYRCRVSLNEHRLGEHEGTCLPFEYDVTDWLKYEGENHLAVGIYRAPDTHSQFGRTSETRHFKPRFTCGWDFAPRIVPLGIWQDVELIATGDVYIKDLWPRPEVDEKGKARLGIEVNIVSTATNTIRPISLICHIESENERLLSHKISWKCPAEGGICKVNLDVPNARIWNLNNTGDQVLYSLAVEVLAEDEVILDRQEKTIGFRRLEWVRTEGAPKDALPYQPVVNGKAMPIFGWNWVPLDNCYGGEINDRYERFIQLAKRAGVNLLRVWGGGLLEKERFYDLCDRAGILVMQEFPLSSSGVDNDLPRDEEFLSKLNDQVRQMIPQRRHHASLGLWCGGNELTEGSVGPPLTYTNPGIAVMKTAVEELDPGRLFLPTCGSGPTGMLSEANADDQLHDVHGPWTYAGPVAHYSLYNRAVPMLHSEFGSPGSSSVKTLRSFMKEEHLLPHNLHNPIWRHHGKWWVNDAQVSEFFGEVESVEDYIRYSQFIQYEALRYSVESDLRNWPLTAGTIPWQFNEPWPGVACTCSVDWYGRAKPAYYGVARAYSLIHASLRYGSLIPSMEGEWKGEIYLSAFGLVSQDMWRVEWKCLGLDGREIAGRSTKKRVENPGTILVQALPEKVRINEPYLLMLRVYGSDDTLRDANDYLFGSSGSPCFSSVVDIAETTLSMRRYAGGFTVKNTGNVPALWVEVCECDGIGARPAHHVSWGYFCLAPGEERDIDVDDLYTGVMLTVRGWNTKPDDGEDFTFSLVPVPTPDRVQIAKEAKRP